MQEVGVKAVVEGLSGFLGSIEKMNTSLKGIGSSGNIVTRALETVNDWFGKLAGSMLRIAEVALGVLVRDAFNAIVNGLKEIISATIEAGSEFQILELRLQRLNFNAALESGKEFADALKDGTQATQEQLIWLQRLAATTPYDFQDIANVFTLARSYGFADEAARGLTEDISNFAAGMGLGNTEIERIIVNMGQMVQQGKVTQREMNDLARGAFVPVNDVLKRMQENVGMTDKAFADFRSTGEGVNAFMEAFSQIVQERFAGASQSMARTFKGATDNLKDFIKSIFGFGLVTPVLDAVGGKLADALGQLTSPENFEKLTKGAGFLGKILGRMFEDITGVVMPTDMSGVADKMVEGMDRLGVWIGTHRDDIIKFFTDLKETVGEVFQALKSGDLAGLLGALGVDQKVIDNILNLKDTITGMFDQIKAWVDVNKPYIDLFFTTLGEIVKQVFENLTGKVDAEGGLQSVLDGILQFMNYVIENKDKIAEFITTLLQVWGVLQLIGFVLGLVAIPLLALGTLIISVVGIITGGIAIFQMLAAVIGFLLSPIGLVIVAIGLWIAIIVELYTNGEYYLNLLAMLWGIVTGSLLLAWMALTQGAKAEWQMMVDLVVSKANELWSQIKSIWENMKADVVAIAEELKADLQGIVDKIVSIFVDTPWGTIGRNIIKGITRGVQAAAQGLIEAVVQAAQGAIAAVEAALGIGSPSKVFFEFGVNMLKGMALGVEEMGKSLQGTMEDAMTMATLPAVYATAQMGGMVSTQNNYTNNYNLTVNSSAATEPILQDYNMLQSVAGA